MMRRITWAILLTAWGILIVGAGAAYLVTRQTVLADLDDSLIARASALAQVRGFSPTTAQAVAEDDRYVIRDHLGRTRARSGEAIVAAHRPLVGKRSFGRLADGSLVRTIELHVTISDGDRETPGTIIYSGSARDFQRLMNRLALILGAVALGCGVVTALVAWRVARSALRPLKATAQVIGEIDERRLNRRIDADALPSELVPMGRHLNDMLARLEQGFTQRKQFLADAAHELRTPVAALLTTIEVALRRPRESPELAATLRTCLSDTRILRRLVETLLEQARSEQLPAAAAMEDADASAIMRECAQLADSLAQAKGVRIDRQYPEVLRMLTQPQRLRSIISNLLANAVEYTPSGGHVALRCRVDDSSLQVEVADTGPGIAPEHLPHIFEPFYRADQAHSAGHLGLGLYLVHGHIAALGGACDVQSHPGQGTTFRVTLPMAVAPARLTAAAAVASRGPDENS